mmetsp:Transcript_15140/g.29776  ORF Transcript_15140/g.29776 Transcript_15140/m.29776 type:complete len:121 (-) Transcript_15140:656-1018(-)
MQRAAQVPIHPPNVNLSDQRESRWVEEGRQVQELTSTAAHLCLNSSILNNFLTAFFTRKAHSSHHPNITNSIRIASLHVHTARTMFDSSHDPSPNRVHNPCKRNGSAKRKKLTGGAPIVG